MSPIALVVHGISYTALLDGSATVVLDAAGALVGRLGADADAELLDACLPADLALALELVRRLVEAEEAQAQALGLATLRRARGSRLAAAHWELWAAIHGHRADDARTQLATLAGAVA